MWPILFIDSRSIVLLTKSNQQSRIKPRIDWLGIVRHKRNYWSPLKTMEPGNNIDYHFKSPSRGTK